jgi:hypothetical protein
MAGVVVAGAGFGLAGAKPIIELSVEARDAGAASGAAGTAAGAGAGAVTGALAGVVLGTAGGATAGAAAAGTAAGAVGTAGTTAGAGFGLAGPMPIIELSVETREAGSAGADVVPADAGAVGCVDAAAGACDDAPGAEGAPGADLDDGPGAADDGAPAGGICVCVCGPSSTSRGLLPLLDDGAGCDDGFDGGADDVLLLLVGRGGSNAVFSFGTPRDNDGSSSLVLLSPPRRFLLCGSQK